MVVGPVIIGTIIALGIHSLIKSRSNRAIVWFSIAAFTVGSGFVLHGTDPDLGLMGNIGLAPFVLILNPSLLIPWVPRIPLAVLLIGLIILALWATRKKSNVSSVSR